MEKSIERNLMNQEEFELYLNGIHLVKFDAVKRFKSVKRAIRRGKVNNYGIIIPNRPFNNRKNTSKRKNTYSRPSALVKRVLYGQF